MEVTTKTNEKFVPTAEEPTTIGGALQWHTSLDIHGFSVKPVEHGSEATWLSPLKKSEEMLESSRDTWKASNPKDVAATTRLDLSLFPATARAYGALAFVEGDQKYGGFNFRNMGVLASTYYAAAGRHLDKWFNGEEVDSKTQVPHLASALACIAVLIDSIEKGNLRDDRPPHVDMGDLLDRMESKVKHLISIFPRKTERFTAK